MPILQFVVCIDGQNHTLDYEDEAQLTTAGLLEILGRVIPDLALDGYLFSAGGIISSYLFVVPPI